MRNNQFVDFKMIKKLFFDKEHKISQLFILFNTINELEILITINKGFKYKHDCKSKVDKK